MATAIMIGSISCPLEQTVLVHKTRTVKRERMVPRTVLKRVLVSRVMEGTIGCGDRCAALCAYTKSSMRRAIAGGDLTRDARCTTCNLLASVGEARSHRISHTILVPEMVETIELVKEDYEVEESYTEEQIRPAKFFTGGCKIGKMSIDPTIMAPAVKVGISDVNPAERTSGMERNKSKAEQRLQGYFDGSYKKCAVVAPLAHNMQKPPPNFETLKSQGSALIEEYEAAQAKLYASKPLVSDGKRFGKIVQKNGCSFIKSASKERIRVCLEEERKWSDFEKAFVSGEFEDAVHPGESRILSYVCRGEQVSFASPYSKVPTLKRLKQPKTIKRLELTEQRINDITREVCKIAKKSGMKLEFVSHGKHALNVRYKKLNSNVVACVNLPHESGFKKTREIHPRKFNNEIKILLGCNTFEPNFSDEDVVRGFSGAILPKARVNHVSGNYDEMVVRGRCDGQLVDARVKVSYHMMHRMTHYSAAEKDFWNGWKKQFDAASPNVDHICVPDLTNEQCGEIAAGVFQRMHPCKTISCAVCRGAIEKLDRDDYYEFIDKHARGSNVAFWKLREKYASARIVLDNADKMALINPDIESMIEITRIVQGSPGAQMQHLSNIQAALMKGATATGDDLSKAMKSLLELSRWFKNHLSQIEKGDVAVFRNKASSKASINFSLLCDNQLDRNGNFVWGERGRHSKRFFSNFFEEVTPGDGYAKYVERVNPNGSRKLAIGHLVVPLDLERAREALEGIPIDLRPVSQACISKTTSFEYTCCCVTNDSGKPYYSSIKSPTKSHLVIGNTGDAKYVDLPSIENEKMFVAKEGYCYVNIFLAMLVNVNEDSAKDFTKRVRDIIIPRLGKWPTMYDLAAACYMLTVFHPETRNAELPRILVDHDNQMMHVIDSFGSLNTGYHVLKAGTIQQLLPFARKTLEGEMKFYRVGGDLSKVRRNNMEITLLRSIYRPKQLLSLIETEPYILFLSLVTPKLIVALYNTGGLDAALSHWIDKDTSLSTSFTILATLAQKVSRVKLIQEQIDNINAAAGKIFEILSRDGIHTMSKFDVMLFIESISNRAAIDLNLVRNGFVSFESSLFEAREKIYAQRLSASWRGLNLWEKFTAIRVYYLRRSPSTDVLTEPDTKGVEDKYAISCGWFCDKIQEVHAGIKRSVRTRLERCTQSVRGLIVKRVSNLLNRCFSDVFYMVNVLLLISMFTSVVTFVKQYFDKANEAKLTHKYNEHRVKMQEVESIYSIYVKAYGTPTEDEFFRFICKHRPDLQDFIEKMFDKVELQSKTYLELNFEKIVAFMALITMMFDEKKSDLVFKVLNKVKSVFGTFGEVVRLQGLDEIDSVESEKKETVDFVLQTDDVRPYELPGSRFEDWWRNQLNQNRVVPHYRLTGRFIEFTRNTLVQVCNTIMTSDEKEFLIRGAVGSGKSTGLPNQLCKKGRVLLLEPTRPLAENVCKQLRKDPFYNNATLRMRGLNSFGSSNVTIMTSGFALHYFAHNQAQLDDIAFVIIDECHVIDASTMAFYCLLMEYSFQGKILRVSATPPGRECEFTPQQPVKVKIEENASFSEFVAAQGTGCNLDVIQDGDNILVYVASYNDVDALGKSLLERGFMVTKVDGRTMKLGGVEIITKGSSSVKHFVVATNIIENGVTLDVDVVVDFGLKVQAELDSDLRCMRYSKIPISYGERIQRLGRVGRVKPGTALRIGHTEKTISEIPVSVATEAAFICFAYGLPVMTHNVTTSMLSKCSVVQARTILNFELSCFFMVDLVSMNGMMHPLIHEELKKFKLRDSEMTLSKLSIPSACVNKWISARDYHRYGVKTKLNEDVRIPFFASNIPERTIENIWKIVCDNKHDAGFGQLKLVNACKIAYTLSIDDTVLPKTIGIIDTLIQQEMEKRAHFENMTSSLTSHSFSLQGIVNRVKSRYLKDYTSQNIQTLQIVRAQIIEFSTATHDLTKPQSLLPYGFLDLVQLEGSDAISARLGLKGVWNESIMTQDVVVLLMLSIGGAWMLWDYFRYRAQDVVLLHGKRRVQKLKFRDARDRKIGREVYADDGTIERMFGEAYTARGKVKGSNKKKGMGNKNRNFVHLYGFDPTEYSFVRFLDPLTGATIDDTINADLQLIQEEFGDIRRQAILDDDITKNAIDANPGIRAYFANPKTHKAIKVDLHPHNPLLMCKRATSIAGFPEREFELRQSGDAKVINFSEVPPEQSQVKLEGKSILRGPRDYNPVARSVCQITNISDGHRYSMYAIGYGSILIAPGHFFQRNNGDFEIQSHMGFFKVTNTTTLKIHHLEGRDLILIRMPKDFPPFPQRLRFRHPIPKEKCCMVSSIYQQKSMSSSVSETTVVMPTEGCHYWKHWITSSEGSCGLPLVSTKDGFLLGIHGLGGVVTDKNYFVTFPEDFEENILHKMDQLDWRVKWKYNVDKVLWGRLCYAENEEDAMFKVNKLARDLVKCDDDFVCMQGTNNGWVLHELSDNLKAVATTESHLVTKHTVKGRCEYFQKYLNENEQAYAYFKPLMSQYGPSRLNKDAFKKDFFKYKPAIIVGLVDDQRFERSVDALIQMMEGLNFKKCNFVTDADEIIDSLNMKASVGAMFKGKKKEYFDLLNDSEREDLLMKSCLRLFRNDMGVWNGSLKAELRHIDKINMNKTRTFTAAPIDTLLGAKSCVDDFNNQFYSLNCVGPWTVGMSKFYRGWHSFLTSLPDGWIYCHADGSRFDSSLTPYLINAIVTVREHFMEDWDVGRTMLHNLYTEVVYTPILTPDGTIVKKFKGNNSGQPSTVVDNTLMVIVAVYYALSATVEELSEIGDFIKFFANGDDLVIAIEPSRVSILDGFKASFGELGLDYDFSERSFDRCDIEFMSHKGLLKDEVYIPKLDKERIVSILEWDRSKEIAHRAEAICAAMIEAWGYDDLLYEIRKFYAWMMDLAEFRDLANVGTFPYIAESALRKLYLDVDASVDELRAYLHVIDEPDEDELDIVVLQGDRSELDAGASSSRRSRTQPNEQALAVPSEAVARDRDVDTGTSGRSVPRLKSMSRKMRMPKINAEILLDLEQLLEYKPEQVDLSNTRATHKQLETWHKAIQEELEVTPEQLKIILNGFMVWCIENGTSPNLNGVWTMMDGDEQVEFPLKPFIENAKPTLRQIMHHFSDAAEAYIEFRNSERVYIPRYALKRNLRDASLARFAFDFYEMHAKTPIRAREAHLQMKAAALSNVSTKMFGLDGNIATQEENTERHVASDVNPDMHTLLGVRHM